MVVHDSMSPRVSASTLGLPDVPLVWYTRLTWSGDTHRLLPNGGSSSRACFSSCLGVAGGFERVGSPSNVAPPPTQGLMLVRTIDYSSSTRNSHVIAASASRPASAYD